MGWKALKEAFGIDGHIVCVAEKGICIGSGHVHDLVVIDPSTGRVVENSTFNGFLKKYYPALGQASPEQVLSLIQTQDTFSASIPVYTFGNGKVIEKRCEKLGWPNVTHEGDPMYTNSYSADKDQVIDWAKRDAASEVKGLNEHIISLREQLNAAVTHLAQAKAEQAMLEQDYPDHPQKEA